MKSIFLSIVALVFVLTSYSQTDEKSSGTSTYSIKKSKEESNASSGTLKFSIKTVKVDDQSESSSETRNKLKELDKTVPVIVITSPQIDKGIKTLVSEKTITITGKVEDESGIFEVLVNDTKAKVSSDGTFQATLFLAYGDNTITVEATDIKQNKNTSSFIIERLTDEISNAEDLTNNNQKNGIANKIIWLSPNANNLVVSDEVFQLNACIESSSEIKNLKITSNNWTITDNDGSSAKYIGDCETNINETVNLKFGKNIIKIQITNNDKVFSSEVVVNYDAISAKYHALIIGVEDYDDSNINDLSEPINDAQKLFDVLVNEYTFEKEDIIFLKNPTKADIIGTLHKMRSSITENDNLLIFYAGHGYWDEEMGNGYWLPSDAAYDNPVNWLPNTDLTNYLNVIKSKHTMLVADACFSGGILKTRNAFNSISAIEKLYQLKSRKAITSGTLKEVPDKSIFLKYLTQRLKENKDKYLTAEQLFSSLRMAVINNSPNIPQYGTIQNVGDEGGDFIFIKK